jgi:hypothetical protein
MKRERNLRNPFSRRKRVSKEAFKAMKRVGWANLFALLFVLFISGISHTQESDMDKTFIVSGRSVVVGEDTTSAERNALHDAMQNAIEQMVGVLIPAEKFGENFELISIRITDKPQGYIKQYDVLYSNNRNGVYTVLIKAQVSANLVKNDLAALNLLSMKPDIAAIHKPRVMIIIPEQHIRRVVPDPAAETEMIRLFAEKGFTVVDQTQVAKIRESDRVKAALQGDEKAAAAIGKQHGAEVIIIGEAFSETAEPAHGLSTCRARIEARAIESDTARILAANAKDAGGSDMVESVAGKKSLQRASGLLADYLIEQILTRWSEKATTSGEVRLVISEVKFNQLVQFEKALKTQISGVEAVHQRSFEAGVATIDVQAKIDAQQLAEELATKKFEGFNVEVTGFTANRVDLKLQGK